MPTIQVTPSASCLLQNVADTVGKSRKVVVITGAGISTNSGIPDFRSEHGLYSLIQAQFDKAEATGGIAEDFGSVDEDIAERPAKRRRISSSQESWPSSSPPRTGSGSDVQITSVCANTAAPPSIPTAPPPDLSSHEDAENSSQEQPESCQRMTRSVASLARPALPRHLTELSSQSSAAADSIFSVEMSRSSTQTEISVRSSSIEQLECSDGAVTPKATSGEQFTSSPLSSPPPVLFDPYERSTESMDSSSQCSDESDTDSEDTQGTDFLTSQTSHARLKNMKGRDLFDSNIWSDPLKTSVFYRFATTLRQKVKEVEPTTTHHFIARLRDVGKLARVYTQNIDEIEKKIGLSTDLKVGAGNKRRKSAKQLQLAEEKNEPEEPTQGKGEDDHASKDASQSSQSDNTGSSKQRPNVAPDKGVECVFLHGSLHALRCFACARLCDWDDEDRETLTMSGEQPECPHCAGATAARQEKGKRALGIGKLRPDIVLYGEEHPQSDLISPIVQHDLSAGPDLLLVLGTSLKVHGLKVMVREFARATHQKGGKVVFINFTKPSESTWGDVIDYWVEWDCDAWVEDLKERKPTLWMSPEAVVEYERSKRGEALAEKRRESFLSKKRESTGDKKRDTLNNKRRATIQVFDSGEPESISNIVPEPKSELRLEPKHPSKPKDPARHPQAERNDYTCGAYQMNKIAEAFYAIRGEPFDFFGYTPPARQSEANLVQPRITAIRERKARKSGPAVLPTLRHPVLRDQPTQRPAVKASLFYGPISRDRFRKAVTDLGNSGRPHNRQRTGVLRARRDVTEGDDALDIFSDLQLRAQHQPRAETYHVPLKPERDAVASMIPQPASSIPADISRAYTPSSAVSAAVKSNPRIRKPTSKVMSNMPSTPTSTSRRRDPQVAPLPAVPDQENVLAPFCIAREQLAGPRLATMEPSLNPSPPHSPLDLTPLASLSPNQRKFSLQHLQHPMMLSAPLIKLPFTIRREPLPSPSVSPSDQLREEAAIALSDMRMCR